MIPFPSLRATTGPVPAFGREGEQLHGPRSPRVVCFMPRIGPVCCRQRKVIVRPIVERDRGHLRKTKANEKGPPCVFRAAWVNDPRALPSHARAAFRARPWIDASLPLCPCPEAACWNVEKRSSCISVSRSNSSCPSGLYGTCGFVHNGAGWRPICICRASTGTWGQRTG